MMIDAAEKASAEQVQPLTPEVLAWLDDQRRLNRAATDIVADMVRSGWQPSVAQKAVTVVETPVEEDERPQPQVALAPGQNAAEIEGHAFKVLVTMSVPQVLVFEGFLTPEECTVLIEQARERLDRSKIVQANSGELAIDTARTSDGMFFQRGESELIEKIESRIAALFNWPVVNGEGLQVLRYRPGAEYRAHYDYFDAWQPGSQAVLARGGQRIGTLVMYLASPASGGATVFPDAGGLAVAPVAGNAVYFGYPRPDPSSKTLHGGSPVLEGEKWVATKWFRERPF